MKIVTIKLQMSNKSYKAASKVYKAWQCTSVKEYIGNLAAAKLSYKDYKVSYHKQ